MDIAKLWENACELIRQQINQVSYKTWIEGGLRPLRIEDDVLILVTPVNYYKTMIAGKYTGMIAECVSKAAGEPLMIQIFTEEEAKALPDPNEQHEQAAVRNVSLQLNARYTFDTFVVGSGNRFAHAASLAVAESPAKAYNPLFIYGGSGLGKTHLMHAIGHFIKEQHPEMQLLYITSEDFTNELISAIQQGQNQEFRNRFRNVDVLMVDDIQSIAGRNSTQEEFFNTFNALHSAGKQIIMTSDRPPKDIATLEERLRSRFEWGLIADIQRPDLETRIAILRKKAESEKAQVDDDVLTTMAERLETCNVRELEGHLNRVIAYARLTRSAGTKVDRALCEEVLKDVFLERAPRVITPDIVIRTVSEYYSIASEEIIGSSRRKEIGVPRQIAMYLTREMTGMSLPQIGIAFGGKDHTSVLYSCRTVEQKIEESASMANLINDLKRLIKEGR